MCDGGLRFFYDNPKGHPKRRLMTPPWRRVEVGMPTGIEAFYFNKDTLQRFQTIFIKKSVL